MIANGIFLQICNSALVYAFKFEADDLGRAAFVLVLSVLSSCRGVVVTFVIDAVGLQ